MPPRLRPIPRLLTPAGWMGLAALAALAVAAALLLILR